MSKKNRGHASSLSALSTIAIDLPTETGAPETAENTNAVEIDAILDEFTPRETVDVEADGPVIASIEAAEADGPVIASIEAAEQINPPVGAPPDESTPDPVPDEVPDEVPAVAAIVVPSADASSLIACLQAKIAALKESKSKRVASGSKPRPNVTYTLLDKPLNWSDTPQVAQLQQILFDPAFMAKHRNAEGIVKIAEPDVFAAITAGAAAGVLRTKQEPVRILQYYRSVLLNANCLRWA